MASARSYCDDLRSAPTAAPTDSPKTDAPGANRPATCRLCHYRFTSDGNLHYYSEQVKEQAIDKYGQGMAAAAISRVLEVNLGTVYERGKKARWALGNPAAPAAGRSAGDFL